MRTVVTNSMIFSQGGTFRVEKLSKERFFEIVKESWEKNLLKSYIGYADTMQYIRQNSGVKLNITKKKLSLRHGDRVAVIKRKYREGRDWQSLGKPEYEYFLVRYHADDNTGREHHRFPKTPSPDGIYRP